MSALDKVLALSRGEAVLDDEFLELAWSPQAREAALKARRSHLKSPDSLSYPSYFRGDNKKAVHSNDGGHHLGFVAEQVDSSYNLRGHSAHDTRGKLLSEHKTRDEAQKAVEDNAGDLKFHGDLKQRSATRAHDVTVRAPDGNAVGKGSTWRNDNGKHEAQVPDKTGDSTHSLGEYDTPEKARDAIVDWHAKGGHNARPSEGGDKPSERLSPNEQVKRANDVLNKGGSQREQSLAVLNKPSEEKAAKSDPLPGPKKDEAIKAGLRVPEKYSPVGATGGYHTPQTHPDEFDSGEIKSEIKMLDRHDKKYGAHPLRAGAKNKLNAHLAERAKK